MNLDPRTIVILTVLSTLLMSIGLFVLARGYLAEMRGVNRWASGTLLQSVGWIFLALTGSVPTYISEIGSPIIMLAMALYYHALVSFKEVNSRIDWVYAVVAINLVAIYYFLLVVPDMSARIVIASSTAALLMTSSSRILLFKNIEKRPVSHTLTGSLFAICGVVLVVRASYYLIWNTSPDQSPFEQNIVQDVAFLTFFVAAVVSPFTYILMCNDLYNSNARLRTLELANKNNELEEASKVKGQFLATMSHELRTPLNGVIGFLNQLGKTRLDSQQQDYLRTIDLSARMLLGVINDVLDYSKIEAGKLSIETIEINLREFFDEIMSMFSVSAEEKGLNLVCVVDHRISNHLIGDPLRLTQIFSNLLGNAIKFTEQGEVLLEVSQVAETDSSVSLQISVSDTGIGISQSSLALLFQPFVQADASTTRKHGGTGLGLIIARRLVAMMGGNIKVESEVWQGTRFTIDLVLEKQAVELGLPDLSHVRLLAVTAKTNVARSIAEYVSVYGIATHSVESGCAALVLMKEAYQKKNPFDAVILDNETRDMPPIEFSRQVQADAALNKTPLLLLGNIAGCQNSDAIKKEGFVSCISRPVKNAELFQELARLLLSGEAATSIDISSVKNGNVSNNHQRLLGKRILIVDDNDINRKLAQLLVEQLSGEFDLAENGAQAVDACSRKKYDLILMDVNMPVMDGLEATRRIRTLESGSRRTPIFALTANALPGDKERFIEKGMDDYLSKPINENTFFNLLDKWCPQDKAAVINSSIEVLDESSGHVVPLLDPVLGVKLSFGDAETWHMVLGILLDDLADYATKLDEVSDDLEELSHVSHKLAGSSCYCGTPALFQAAKQVEINCSTGDLILLKNSLAELHLQIDRMLKLDAAGQLRRSDVVVY
jgi:signal transduction histidine kinase/DNA-binding response OmpR family regulator